MNDLIFSKCLYQDIAFIFCGLFFNVPEGFSKDWYTSYILSSKIKTYSNADIFFLVCLFEKGSDSEKGIKSENGAVVKKGAKAIEKSRVASHQTLSFKNVASYC